MRFHRRVIVCGWLILAGAAGAAPGTRTLPGLQPDSFVRLHNQWLIRPAGTQVELGDFPVNLAVDRTGRYAAALHMGNGPHEIRLVDLCARQVVAVQPVTESFYGIAFSPDGRTLVCSGGGDGVLHRFAFHRGRLEPAPEVRLLPPASHGVVAGVAFSPDDRTVVAGVLFDSQVVCADLATGQVRWTTPLAGVPADANGLTQSEGAAPNEGLQGTTLDTEDDPLALVWDARRNRIYASLWGQSAVAVLDAADGHLLARWDAGWHPNELLLARDGRHLFVANGGRNTVTVIATADGSAVETLCSSLAPDDPPGSIPDSLALSPDGQLLYVANANNNNVAVFDVSAAGCSRALGFIPTGWMPTSVRVTPDGRTLLVISARGLEPKANSLGSAREFTRIVDLYHGALGIVDLPERDGLPRALAFWTATAQRCRPAPAVEAAAPGPIPAAPGGASPIRHVIYVIKENRTYDQVFGDLAEGNGDPALCLFPEAVTPNLHALARDFVLLDNFYANAEISATGHEWSMAGWASEFVEKTWPTNYGHKQAKVPYTAEGHYAAALPELGYLWDRAAAAGVSYRSYGEFGTNGPTPADPVTTALPALRGHLDPGYHAWDLAYHDTDRAARFIAELHRFEAAGDMPRLQIVRLPQDHTEGAKKGARTPRAMVADNDLALGRVVEAVSRSRFWPDTAIFVVEDDAQNGPDHVDAHRTEALVISPWCRRHAVDSTPYTTCSMLRTMELILGLEPMSQFDAAATPMRASFQARPDAAPWTARPAQVDLEERNPGGTAAARVSATLDFSKEDAIDDQTFNRVIWAAVRGEASRMPAPVHAAFVRAVPAADADDD